MTQTPAGWYPVDNGNERYWSGSEWTDQIRPVPPPTAPPAPVATQVAAEPAKKKKRIFLWVFLAIQLLFIVWIIGGMSSSDAGDCGSLDAETCEAANDVGTGIGVFIIIVFWMMVDFLLAVGYGIYRLAKRP